MAVKKPAPRKTAPRAPGSIGTYKGPKPRAYSSLSKADKAKEDSQNTRDAKYTKQRKDDEKIVTKAYNKGTPPEKYGPTTRRAGKELTTIGNKIFENSYSDKARKFRQPSQPKKKP